MNTKMKKSISVLLVVCMMLSLFAGSAYAAHRYFEDAKGHWAEDAINILAEKGVLAGYPDGLSQPDEIITRAEFATLVARTLELPEPDEKEVAIRFTDLAGHWSEKNVEALIIAGIIQKDDFESKFLPDQPITRMEMIRMLVRAIGKGEHDSTCPCDIGFLDESQLTEGQKAYICTGKHYHIISGYPDGTVRPDSDATRGEAFEMLVDAEKAKEQIKKEEPQKPPAVKPEDKPSGGGGSSYVPAPQFSFTLPGTAHTDTAVAVELNSENLGSNAVTWSLVRDGKEVALAEALNGEMTAEGGTVVFTEKGCYTLTASITDGLGKTITAEDSITVYPVAEVKLTLPAVSHTDKTVAIKTETKEADGLRVAYTLTKNGEPVETGSAIDGNIADGAVRFTEKGVYALTASLTDGVGRVFADTASITVYPVGSAGFYLPEIFHTDKTVTVEAVFGEIGSHTAKWSLLRDGKEVALADTAKGMLTNTGGELQFTEKGSYVLAAEFTDDGGRSYRYEQSFKVYPLPDIRYSLPKYAHTDSDITVTPETTDLDGLTIQWLLDNTYGFQDWPTYVDGRLTNDGGILRFKRAGIYELVARITDETGRVFLFESGGKCEVLPVLTISFELPELAYTDTFIGLRTHGNNGVLPVEWTVVKDGKQISLSEAFSGDLNAQGGKFTFKTHGEYVLTATMTDYLKRSYTHSETVAILPVVQYAFTMPQTVHFGTEFAVAAKDAQHLGSYPVAWTLQKDGAAAAYQGTLGNEGGRIAIYDTGSFTLTAAITDRAGRITTHAESITVTNTAPNAPTMTAAPTRTAKDGKFLVDITASATDPDGDAVTLEYEGTTADSYYAVGAHTIRVRAKDTAGAYSAWTEKSFSIVSSAPTVTLTASPTRTVKDGKFLVNITAAASDADGDATTLEWENKAVDHYYTAGTHTVRVRAKDSTGLYSAWEEKTFTIENSAPTAPVITRTPSGNSVAPGTPVTITATSSDPDGDAITLVWEGRNTETQTYPLGKNVVRVKAVDSTGAESPWAAIVFFVADSNGSGGMTLTGPDSVILENGIDDATITEYTFTVPPVSGHSGGDHGRVRGYNKLTGQWDQLDYGTTSNGITFSRTLGAGVYTKLELYYYTNHSCMYNKSNITYSVTYHFE